MAKKMGRCGVCRQWISPTPTGKIASHRVPREDGNGTEKCRGTGSEPVQKRGKW